MNCRTVRPLQKFYAPSSRLAGKFSLEKGAQAELARTLAEGSLAAQEQALNTAFENPNRWNMDVVRSYLHQSAPTRVWQAARGSFRKLLVEDEALANRYHSEKVAFAVDELRVMDVSNLSALVRLADFYSDRVVIQALVQEYGKNEVAAEQILASVTESRRPPFLALQILSQMDINEPVNRHIGQRLLAVADQHPSIPAFLLFGQIPCNDPEFIQALGNFTLGRMNEDGTAGQYLAMLREKIVGGQHTAFVNHLLSHPDPRYVYLGLDLVSENSFGDVLAALVNQQLAADTPLDDTLESKLAKLVAIRHPLNPQIAALFLERRGFARIQTNDTAYVRMLMEDMLGDERSGVEPVPL